jgi:hypothetical protein
MNGTNSRLRRRSIVWPTNGELEVGVGEGVAVAGEMLPAAEHAGLGQALEIG